MSSKLFRVSSLGETRFTVTPSQLSMEVIKNKPRTVVEISNELILRAADEIRSHLNSKEENKL